MATKYFMAAGNWNDDSKWSTTSSAGPNNTTAAVAADDAILDAGSGNCTLTANAACSSLTCTGYTGTLALATFTLTTSANVTLPSGMTLSAGTNGRILMNSSSARALTGGVTSIQGSIEIQGSGTCTITSNGTTWPIIYPTSAGKTIELGDDLVATQLDVLVYGDVIFSGAHDITVGGLCFVSTSSSLVLVAGRTLTVSSTLAIHRGNTPVSTAHPHLKSATTSSSANLCYTGATAAGIEVSGVQFTDIAYSGSTVTNLDNWYGGTLTRTTGITNRTSADIGGGTGGVTGRCLQLGVGVC